MNAMQTAAAVDAINALDLGAIKTKLMHRASGEGWTAAYADAVEIEYRRFLTLMKLYPNEATAPLVDVDTFWHYHILDTAKYATDCASAFGYFLHHYPYLGMDGAADEANRDTAGARMHELYAATFGVAMAAAPADTAWCGRSEQPAQQATAWCGRSEQPAQQATAWCGRSEQPAQPAQNAQPALAWCGMATTAPAKSALAWCGMATTAPAQSAMAWCGAARPAVQVRNTVTPAATQPA
jgi:hypothetical protein